MYEDNLKQIAKAQNGDEEARNILIERNLRLVAHVVKKYSNTKVDADDLISIGTIGLIKGINSFNVDKHKIWKETNIYERGRKR